MQGLIPVMKALFMVVTSFFVLFCVTKTESKGLKQFGRIIAFTLWIIAAYLIILGLYARITGIPCKHGGLSFRKMHHGKMIHR
ncbi:MAG: hypothetical protein JSW40_02245 [Candidatus Omnitrophota bacterium]|nr:MAG: hypothetical protein JSW40_02245 [Candidatus Omnitrophota bacterium]